MLPNLEWWSRDRPTDRQSRRPAAVGGKRRRTPRSAEGNPRPRAGDSRRCVHRAPTMGDWARWLLMVKLPRNLYGAFRFIRRSGRAGSRTAPLFSFLFTDAAVTEILRARRRPWNRGNKFHVRINNPGGSDAPSAREGRKPRARPRGGDHSAPELANGR